MSDDGIDGLLAKMPQIAKVVNAFQSEAVQLAAFHFLTSGSLSGVHGNRATEGGQSSKSVVETPTPRSRKSNSAGAKGASRTPPKRTASSVSLVRDLDLRPPGKKAFADFAAEKSPKDNQERYAVAVYWLEQIAELESIGLSHIATVFRLTDGWREPSGLVQGLKMTAYRKNTIDTSDLNNLVTTPEGRNFVELDLPRIKE